MLVRNRSDRHYLKVGRWLTPFIIFGSFAYVPFLLQQGMILFYLKIVGAFVVPLLTIYLMGAITQVHRRSATVGLMVGVGYGILFLIAELVAKNWEVAILFSPFSNPYAVAPISMLSTAGSMFAFSFVYGWEPRGQLATLEQDGWLASTSAEIQQLAAPAKRNETIPTVLMWLTLLVGIILSYVVIW